MRAEVEAGIQYLLQRRAADPYGDLLKRLVYEHPPGQPARQAPTFPLD